MTTPISPNPSVSAPGHGEAFPPTRIWLQHIDEDGEPRQITDDAMSWCQDRINDTDAEYVLATPVTEAAPDLLAACEAMLEEFSVHLGGAGSYVRCTAVMDAMLAAVAKAHRGEAGSARGMTR